jgi:sensor histidine kinase YesM
MLVEIVLSTIFSIIGFHGYYVEFMGAFISKILMFTSATAVGQYLKRKGGYDVPVRYVLMLIFIPTGSIYIMHNVFLIGINTKKYQFFSVVTGILLLLINYIIFEVYDSLAENAEYQKKNLLFKQQLDLCDQQASEREKQNLKIRSLRHDMKNYLACLLGMVKEGKTEDATDYIEKLLEANLTDTIHDVSRSGNIVIDSLVNYKCYLAKKAGVKFYINAFIPTVLPFQNGHLTVILGNLLENALDACRNMISKKRFIELKMSYRKEILSIEVCNSYEGKRYQDSFRRFLTTKEYSYNHGLGLASVEQSIVPYHGKLIAECNDNIFQVTIVMYANADEK